MTKRLVPELQSRGFNGPAAIAGSALLFEYKRPAEEGRQVLRIQLEKRGLPRFAVGFYVEPPEGMERIVAIGGVIISGTLKPRPGPSTTSWFRTDRSWWERLILRRPPASESEVVEACAAMLEEVDAWWVTKRPSAHIQTWPTTFPGIDKSMRRSRS